MNTPEQNKFFHSGDFHMEYKTWGKGKRIMLALHGFGRSLDDFHDFTIPLSDVYTVYAVNIFYHGKSIIVNRNPEKNPLSIDEFADFFEAFIDYIGCEKISILGYSLGGRLGMKITEVLPARVERLFLFAPDGLIKNRWYVLLSHNYLGRQVFKLLINNNSLYNGTLNAFVKIGFVSQRLKRFIENQTGTRDLKMKVFDVWTALRKIEPDFKVLKKSVEKHEITFKIFIGAYDNIIPLRNARSAKRRIPAIEISVIRSGHKMLTLEIAQELKKELV